MDGEEERETKEGKKTDNGHLFPRQPPPRPRQQTSCAAEAGRGGWGCQIGGVKACDGNKSKWTRAHFTALLVLICSSCLFSSLFLFLPPPPFFLVTLSPPDGTKATVEGCADRCCPLQTSSIFEGSSRFHKTSSSSVFFHLMRAFEG